MANLIYSRVCTLWELQNLYSLHDAMMMLESIFVPRYNEWREMKRAQDKAKQKGF